MYIVIVIVVCVLLLFGTWLYKFILKQKSKPKKAKKVKEKPKKSKISPSTTVKNVNLKVKNTYMVRKELLFWKFLNLILPKGFIVVPKVSLGDLLSPDGDRKIYNLVFDKTIDYVIFSEQTMYPMLIIDIYDKSYSDEKLDEQDPLLGEILTKLQLKVLSILVSNNFDREQAKKDIFKALNIQELKVQE